MISGVRCLLIGSVMACASVTAFGNAMSYNGFLQTAGSSGIDLSNLDGGSYRVTMTDSGQLNFRYTFGNQVFDSNPEAAISHYGSNANYERNDLTSYSSQGPQATYIAPQFGLTLLAMLATDDPTQYLDNVSQDLNNDGSASSQAQFQSRAAESSMGLESSGVDVGGLQPVSYYAPNVNGYAFVQSLPSVVVADANPTWMSFDPAFGLEENPEPGTIALAGGALLLGFSMMRRRARRA